MKKTIAFLLTLVMLLSMAVAVIPASAEEVTANEDWGESTDGIYRISTAADLLAFSSFASLEGFYADKTVVLTNDIDMTGVEFFYVAELHGTLDGQGHAIKNLELKNCGFIRKLMNGACVKNIRFINVSQTPSADMAGIVGLSVTGNVTFENVYVQGTVSAKNLKMIGGFVGFTNLGTASAMNTVSFTNCVSDVVFTETGTQFGGFLGRTSAFSKATFTDCAFLGDLSKAGANSSNFAGMTIGSVEMTRCVSLGRSSSNYQSGVFVFLHHNRNGYDASVTLNDCYAAISGSTYSSGTGDNKTEWTQHAVGAHNAHSWHETLTVNYGGRQALQLETAEDNTVYKNMELVEGVMQYFAKGDTVNLTKDNFKANYTALSADDKWVVMGDETVTYATDKTVAKIMPAAVKALIDTADAPADNTGNNNNGNDGGNAGGDNTDNNGGNANLHADTTSDTAADTAADTNKTDDTSAETEAEKSGCGSVIGGSAIALAAVIGGAFALAGKKKED